MEIPRSVSKNIDGSKSNKLMITLLILSVMALFSLLLKVTYGKDESNEKTISKLEKRIDYLDSCLSDCGRESLKREKYRSDLLDDRENTKDKLIEKLKIK